MLWTFNVGYRAWPLGALHSKVWVAGTPAPTASDSGLVDGGSVSGSKLPPIPEPFKSKSLRVSPISS